MNTSLRESEGWKHQHTYLAFNIIILPQGTEEPRRRHPLLKEKNVNLASMLTFSISSFVVTMWHILSWRRHSLSWFVATIQHKIILNLASRRNFRFVFTIEHRLLLAMGYCTGFSTCAAPVWHTTLSTASSWEKKYIYTRIHIYIYTRGASPRRASARLGSEHARNSRRCMTYIMSIGLQANGGCTCDSTAKGDIHINRVLNKEKETLKSGAKKNMATNCVIRHTMTYNNSKQQQPPNNFNVHAVSTTSRSGSCCSSTTASSISSTITCT